MLCRDGYEGALGKRLHKSLKSGVRLGGVGRAEIDVMGDVMRPSSHIKKSSGFIIELSGAISGLKSIRLILIISVIN